MKHIIPLLACMLLGPLCTKVSADEPELKDHGLVLMIHHQDEDRTSNIFRVTIENRSTKPIQVIPPLDIKHPWGQGGWWYCGAYRFYLHSATLGRTEYVCETPPPPAVRPMPVPPDRVTLLPGQSIGAFRYLPLPVPVEAARAGEPDLPPNPPMNWQRTKEESTVKPPASGYSLTVEYRPVEYQSGVLPQPIVSQKDHVDKATPELVPSTGKKIISNALLFGVKKPDHHPK